MKMRVIVQGSEEFSLDPEYAAPAILAAITGVLDIRSEIIDYTDTERSDIDRDEYVEITEDDGKLLWQGWLDSDKADVPPPAEREALEQLAALMAELRELHASWTEPEDHARMTRDEIVEQHIYQECARSLLNVIGDAEVPGAPAERERHVSEVAADGSYIYGGDQ